MLGFAINRSLLACLRFLCGYKTRSESVRDILATLDFRQTARSDKASLPPIGQLAAGWQPAVRLAPDSDLHGPAQRRV